MLTSLFDNFYVIMGIFELINVREAYYSFIVCIKA